MPQTFEELKKKTIAELRAIAKDTHHDAVQGYTQMNKEHLLPALCRALGIDAHEHHAAHLGEKAGIRATMRQLKTARDEAIAAHDYDRLRDIRREYHHLNHSLRRAAKRETLH
jgi:DNA polymerase III alpha subunit (gram-positive type)